ncbi:MAG: tetratricopeptide repeat protein [Candidatus Krumholzibacteria bacterium]|nr:tetratricopeptide repeat protein [Candidatus Krumholzibacteria bacterium]
MTHDLHLTEEQLSILADGKLAEGEGALLRGHLRACPECSRALQDLRRYTAIWETDASVLRAPAELAAFAHGLPRRERAAGRPLWTTWAPRLAAASALVAAVAAIALWQPWRGPAGGGDYDRLLGPVQAAVETASNGGAILLPGAEATAASTLPGYRAGHADADEAVAEALRMLSQVYLAGRASADVAHWLVSGFIAVGDIETARVYAEDARLRFPDDVRFIVLEAITAYRSNEMPRAERLLQTALERDPQSGAALLNLGLVQYEQGQWDNARRTFQMVRARFAGSPLEARAAALLTDLLGG